MASDPPMVAAIDFGTTYSGYAFSTRSDYKTDPLKIHANQAWNAGGRQLLSLKTPTVLLLDKNKKFVSFGYEAENQYSDLMMDKEHEDYYYFHRFKMKLHRNKHLSTNSMIEDITGKSALTMEVFSLSIQALKDHLMETLDKRGTAMTVKDIRWVLTVPAIWTDAAKQFMRKSAEKAGIPGDGVALAGDATHINDVCFQHFITKTIEGVLDKSSRNTIEDDKVFNKLDKSILKEAYSGVLALLLEAAKFDAETATLSAILEECKFTQDRIDILLQLYQEKKLFIQILLGNIGTSPPHIVDVDWRLDYHIKSNQLEKVNEPVYLISLKTEVPGKTDLEEVQFSCSLEQLQDFVGKLKDATKCLEKIGQV